MVKRCLSHLHRGGGVGLAQPQWLMEIDVTAVIPDDWQGRQQNDSLLAPAARNQVSSALPLVRRAWPWDRAVRGYCPASARSPVRT